MLHPHGPTQGQFSRYPFALRLQNLKIALPRLLLPNDTGAGAIPPVTEQAELLKGIVESVQCLLPTVIVERVSAGRLLIRKRGRGREPYRGEGESDGRHRPEGRARRKRVGLTFDEQAREGAGCCYTHQLATA